MKTLKSGIYDSVTSWADLAALRTVDVINSVIILWIETSTGEQKTTQLRMGTDETDTGNGIQRPDDYGPGNRKVWYSAE